MGQTTLINKLLDDIKFKRFEEFESSAAMYYMSKGEPVPEGLIDLINEENEDEKVKKALILVIEIHNASVKK